MGGEGEELGALALSPADFGLTRPEAAFLRRLKPAWRIQRFLDSIDYDAKGQGCRSPRRWGSVARSNYSGLRYREPIHLKCEESRIWTSSSRSFTRSVC
jgi:hypothetical protein